METLHDFRKDTFWNDLYRGRAEADRVERGAQTTQERALGLGLRNGNEKCPHLPGGPGSQAQMLAQHGPLLRRGGAQEAARSPGRRDHFARRGGSTQAGSIRPSAAA